MGLNVWIWMGGNPFLGLLGVGPGSRDFWAIKWQRAQRVPFGPNWHSLPFNGPKVSTFRAHPFKQPSLWISPYPNPYVPSHINNRYIITINVPVLEMWRDIMKSTLENHLNSPGTKSRLFKDPETFLAP